MAQIKSKVLAQVTTKQQYGTIEVKWNIDTTEGGELVLRVSQRCAYSSRDKSKFGVEVDKAATHMATLGW